jgi:hypothetical protein
MWIIQWTGPNGRSNWRKMEGLVFTTETAALEYFTRTGMVHSPDRYRIAKR